MTLTVLPHKKLKSSWLESSLNGKLKGSTLENMAQHGGKSSRGWFDLPRQPVRDGERHEGMREAVSRIHRLLFSALDQGPSQLLKAFSFVFLCRLPPGAHRALRL